MNQTTKQLGFRVVPFKCEEIDGALKAAMYLGDCLDHTAECDVCKPKVNSLVAALTGELERARATFGAARDVFRPRVQGGAGGLALQLANHAESSYEFVYAKGPLDQFAAGAWLPTTFYVCRVFESQYPKLEEKAGLHVGEMIASDGRPFKDLTSLAQMMKEDDPRQLFTYNYELQQDLIAKLKAGKNVDALRLICDSPKHGVLSSFLNVGALFHAATIYAIGFAAMAQAIGAFTARQQAQGAPGPAS